MYNERYNEWKRSMEQWESVIRSQYSTIDTLLVGICYTICNMCTADIKVITITASLTVNQWSIVSNDCYPSSQVFYSSHVDHMVLIYSYNCQ